MKKFFVIIICMLTLLIISCSSKTTEEIASLEKEKDALNLQITNLENASNNLQEEIAALKDVKKALDEQIENLEIDNAELLKIKESLELQIANLETESYNLKTELNELKEQNNLLQIQISSLKDSNKDLQEEIDKLKTENTNLLIENTNLKDEYFSLIADQKEKNIEKVENYLNEIDYKSFEYNNYLFDKLFDNVKKEIESESSIDNIYNISSEAILKINSFLLTDDEIHSIKQAYCDFRNENVVNPEYHKKIEDVSLKYFFGKYSGCYVSVINGDMLDIPENTIYIGSYEISVIEVINIFNNGKYYNLKEAYEMGLISYEDVGNVYNDWKLYYKF